MELLATCHVHSDWSYDGSWTLEALRRKFQGRGSRVLMMTEHDRGFTVERWNQYREACSKTSSGEILVLPGIEYSDAENRVHVLVWGPIPFLGGNLPTGEMLDKVHAAGGVAVLAHPSRKDVWKAFDPAWKNRLIGIEVWNRKYDGWSPSQTAPALLQQTGAVPFVGLDFHTHRQSFPLNMVLEIEGGVSEEKIIACLRARRCKPRAFRYSVEDVGKLTPVLRVAENGRRALASIVRKSFRRRTPLKKS